MNERARPAQARQQEVGPSAVRRGRAMGVSGLTRLQATAGNQAITRMIQRKDLGSAKGGKSWMSTGGFDSKHLVSGAVDEDTAKARYTERYNKGASVPDGRQANSVVGEADLKAAMSGGKVAGTYPGRTDRKELTVTVAGLKVVGSKSGGKQVPTSVTPTVSTVVEGSGSDSMFFPDHLVR